MTNQKLYQALEICLQALEHGADVESCLALFPAMADDLRPILTAALQARSGAVADVPADAARRGKARVLQAAAEMREQTAVAPAALALRHWQKGLIGTRLFRLAVTTAAMLAFLLTGGTGLVSASSSALRRRLLSRLRLLLRRRRRHRKRRLLQLRLRLRCPPCSA